MNRIMKRHGAAVLAAFVLATLSACATVSVNPLPPPPSTAKLRVFVHALTVESGEPSRKFQSAGYGTPNDEYVKNQVHRVQRILERTGIYEVVNEREVAAVIGDQHITLGMLERDRWAATRDIGRAMHADYVMIVARTKQRGQTGNDFVMHMTLVNTQTGKEFRSGFGIEGVTGADRVDQREMSKAAYRKIFAQAKEDMLTVAVRKGRAFAPPAAQPAASPKQETPSVPKKPETQPATPPAPIRTPEPQPAPAPVKPSPTAAPKETAVPSQVKQQTPPPLLNKEDEPMAAQAVEHASNLPGSGLIAVPKKDTGAKKLVVYDLETTDQYRTVALILAEALREEVFKLKQYVLVNREDLQKVLEEMALQQTGLIDEKEAVKTGKGLAANQVVTGRFGQLGKTFMMQAKRVDVETFGTLGMASVKFTEGQEDEVMNKLPDFARELVSMK